MLKAVHLFPISLASIETEAMHGVYKRQNTKNDKTLALLEK